VVVAAEDALGAAAEADPDGLEAELGAAVAEVAVGVADALLECVLPFAQAESAVMSASELASTSGERRTRRPQAFGEERSAAQRP
jgi:formaldehyde-activating enzyme involved in methanogenesis